MFTEAVWFVGPKRIEIRPLKLQTLKEDEIGVRVRACGVCKNDVFLFENPNWGQQMTPYIPGHEGIGEVERVGKNVRDLSVGDKVALLQTPRVGHFARQVVIPRRLAVPIFPLMNKFESWIIEPVACVVNALEHLHISPGSTVAVVGCGFMGLLFIQGIQKTLCSTIIAIDLAPNRLWLAQKFGAQQIFDVKDAKGLVKVGSAFAGKVDLVIEVAGTQESLALATELVAPRGQLCIFAWHHDARTIDVTVWQKRGIVVFNPTPSMCQNLCEMFCRALSLMQKGVFCLDELITHIRPYTEAQQLLEIASSSNQEYIKGVLTF